MIENAPLRSLTHKGLTIQGYSRAAVQSYWRIPELKLGFDLGAQPWAFMATGTWFLSHTHLDHIAALPVYVARRRMMKMEPPTIYVPEASIEPIEKLLKAVARLDHAALGVGGPITRALARLALAEWLESRGICEVSETEQRLPSPSFASLL